MPSLILSLRAVPLSPDCCPTRTGLHFRAGDLSRRPLSAACRPSQVAISHARRCRRRPLPGAADPIQDQDPVGPFSTAGDCGGGGWSVEDHQILFDEKNRAASWRKAATVLLRRDFTGAFWLVPVPDDFFKDPVAGDADPRLWG